EVFPGCPARHQQAVGDQHTRGVFVGDEDAHRFSRLHQQRLIALQPSQRRDDRMERWPVAGRFAGAAIDDQVFRTLGDLRVEVVAEHSQRGLLLPAAGAELGAARGADRRGDGQRPPPCPPPRAGEETIAARRPLRTNSMAAWISGSSTRSWSSVGTFSRIAACASPVRRPGLSGASRSIPCAAPSASSARMASTLVATWRARWALCQPMLLWSSWSAEVGSEWTLAGVASSWLSVARAAAVYWSSMYPESRPECRVRNGGSSERKPVIIRKRRRSEILPSSLRPMLAVSSASASGSPWKLPPESTASSSAKTRGLSVPALSSTASTRPR